MKTWLLIVDGLFFLISAYFVFETIREREAHARKVGMGLMLLAVILALGIVWVPWLRPLIGLFFALGIAGAVVFAIPTRPDPKILQGANGHLVAEPVRHDERDISFARVRAVPPGSPYYKKYYTLHPEREEWDAKRREKGLLGGARAGGQPLSPQCGHDGGVL